MRGGQQSLVFGHQGSGSTGSLPAPNALLVHGSTAVATAVHNGITAEALVSGLLDALHTVL